MPKNIILLLSDQHNAKVLGHMGHPIVRTPNLDRMAGEGTRFNNCITANPICTPSRVSFLSGQYPHNHGYYGLSGPNPGGLPSLLSHCRDTGYRTAAIGKIHCPDGWIEGHADVFEDTCGTSGTYGRSASYTEFLQREGVEHLEDHQALTEFKNGKQSMDSRPSPLSFDQSQEGWIAKESIRFMQQCRGEGQSFCLHASMPRPHQCTTPCREFWDLYDIDESALPPNAEYDMAGKAPHIIERAHGWQGDHWALLEPRDFRSSRLRKLRGYLGAISQVDHAVGRILDFLRTSGLIEDTVVIYSSDHGDYACEHGIMEKAPGICSDAITRVPSIWWGDGVNSGKVFDETVSTTDTAITLCGLAGLPAMETSDGENLAGAIKGSPTVVLDNQRPGVTEFAWSKSLRKGKYRYVYYPKTMFADQYPEGFAELYDLESDPWEMRNLACKSEYAALVEELRTELMDWLVTTTRPVSVLGVNSMAQAVPASGQTKDIYGCTVNTDMKIAPKYITGARTKNYL